MEPCPDATRRAPHVPFVVATWRWTPSWKNPFKVVTLPVTIVCARCGATL